MVAKTSAVNEQVGVLVENGQELEVQQCVHSEDHPEEKCIFFLNRFCAINVASRPAVLSDKERLVSRLGLMVCRLL